MTERSAGNEWSSRTTRSSLMSRRKVTENESSGSMKPRKTIAKSNLFQSSRKYAHGSGQSAVILTTHSNVKSARMILSIARAAGWW